MGTMFYSNLLSIFQERRNGKLSVQEICCLLFLSNHSFFGSQAVRCGEADCTSTPNSRGGRVTRLSSFRSSDPEYYINIQSYTSEEPEED